MASSARLGPALLGGLVLLASLTVLSRADAALGPRARARRPVPSLPSARLAPSANGRSGAVRIITALPSEGVNLPLELSNSPEGILYDWVPTGSLRPVSSPRSLTGPIIAPSVPGLYRLVLTAPGQGRVFDSVTVAVLKPMDEKRGSSLNGYRIGYYRGARGELPAGFIEVDANDAQLQVSEHLTIQDFITHDGQSTWPRYVALDPRLLDKLELVFEEIARLRGARSADAVDVAVRSGFRTPLHNQRVPRAAGDSRHQYGDAADIAVDANGDGRITAHDVNLIARAVEVVEKRHPDLAGGLGVYLTGSPYAHIDARGERARWRSETRDTLSRAETPVAPSQ